MPTWSALREGVRPDNTESKLGEPGEWERGWQYFAASTRERKFRRRGILAASSPSDRAHLYSRSGPGAGAAISVCPTAPECTTASTLFRALLLDRLRLPLQLCGKVCAGCGAQLDLFGVHRSAGARSGRTKRRAVPLERVVARICREGGALVRTNVRPPLWMQDCACTT